MIFSSKFIPNITAHYKNELRIYCCHDTALIIKTPLVIEYMRWHSICFSLELQNKMLHASIDGKYYSTKVDSQIELKIRSNGFFYMAQEQDFKGGGFSIAQTLRGKIAEFWLFNSKLSKDEMQDFSGCSSTVEFNKKNPLLSFQNLTENFEVSRVKIEYNYTTSDDPCNQTSSWIRILTEPRNLNTASMICKAVGGYLSVPLNENEKHALFALASTYYDRCFTANTDYLWIGAKGNQTDQRYYHLETEKPLENVFTIWKDEIAENQCVSMFSSRLDLDIWFGGWTLTSCNLRKCTPCTFNSLKTLSLRGLCSESVFDKIYYIYNSIHRSFFITKVFRPT